MAPRLALVVVIAVALWLARDDLDAGRVAVFVAGAVVGAFVLPGDAVPGGGPGPARDPARGVGLAATVISSCPASPVGFPFATCRPRTRTYYRHRLGHGQSWIGYRGTTVIGQRTPGARLIRASAVTSEQPKDSARAT